MVDLHDRVIRLITESKPTWKFDILDATYEITNPNVVDMQLKITQPTRGVYAVNGSIDIKVDLTDEITFEIDILYSKSGTGNSYRSTPFRLRKMNLTEFVNWPYKDYLRETLRQCAKNYIEFEGKFVAPVEKTCITLEECKFDTDNMPTMMKNGFYKLEAHTTYASLSVLVQIYDSIY
uniref:Uncharacterized protein n=1 Tax=Glossina brevipalpis TaxID=37001 RepID=A0A1A9X5P1_9MUSC